MKLFVEGRIAFPFGFFHERVDHFLDERRLKPQLHFQASLTCLFSIRYDRRNP